MWHVPSAHNCTRRVTDGNMLVSISSNTVVMGRAWYSHGQPHDVQRRRIAFNLGGSRMKRLRGRRGPSLVAALVGLVLLAVVLVFGVVAAVAASAARSFGGALSNSSVVDAAPTPAAGCAVKPTIVLVHGAWANTASWSGEVDRLQRDGYAVRAVDNPLRGLTSDAADVADFLRTISGPIVLVGHSYGGAVITNAAAGNRNVKALVYVDAAAPTAGAAVGQLSGKTSALGGAPQTLYDAVPYRGAPAGGTDLYLKERLFLQAFAPDLPTQTAQTLWASQSPAAMSAFTTPSSAAAWQTIPSWYVIGTADQIITPESEMFMAHHAHARILLVPGGSHLTLISHPTEVTNQILAAAQVACSSS
jgi:pimeloyl-ACP methyl ester carboxylesterase